MQRRVPEYKGIIAKRLLQKRASKMRKWFYNYMHFTVLEVKRKTQCRSGNGN
jgi:hypothetical protein